MTKLFLSKTITLIFILVMMTPATMSAQSFGGKDIFPEFRKSMKYPALTPDGDYLVFLTDDGDTPEAYESRRENGQWTAPTPFAYINKLIQQSANEVGGFSFNHDGTTLYFHAKIGSNYFDIFYARKTKAGWSEPQRIGKPISMDADLTSPAISSNNKTLFVLQTKNPENKKEICKKLLLFEKNNAGEWTGPKYLPDEFNIGCQETPFFCADNNILLFASRREGLNRAGKKTSDDNYDIYHARRIDENNWFYPVYVDELNSDHNDLSPMLNSEGDYFVYAVKAKNAKKNPQKIFTATLPGDKAPSKTFVIEGAVVDLYSKQPVETNIVVQDAITSIPKGEFISTDEGRFSIIVPRGAFYQVDFSKNNYSHTFYYKDLSSSASSGGAEKGESFDVKLFNKVNLELNVYDGELFYPVTPKVMIYDSLSGEALPKQQVVNVSKGKYNCSLAIGHLYRIRIEGKNYVPYETYFDLRTDVVYSDFEKSLELQAARKQLTLMVSNDAGELLSPVDITVVNRSSDENSESILRTDGDLPLLMLRTGNTYELNVSKKGFTYFNTQLNYETVDAETMKITLDSLTAKTRMVFNNITFETNSAELNTESFAELNRIVDFLKSNSSIRIEISAHTDDVGSQEYNARLSDKRAASAVKFLTDGGIAEDRLQSKGYGKLQPLVANTSDENRAKNRRVEIRIIE